MKYLLTSGGVRNPSIHNALLELLGKPIAECNALCIPTAIYAHPYGTPKLAWEFITGQPTPSYMCELGWKSMGVLELTALPSLNKEHWVSWVRKADVLLVDGGDALYLSHWVRESGLFDIIPSLSNMVWVGLSAGSMVVTPRIGQEFVGWKSPTNSDKTLGLVNFSIFPHLDYPTFPENTLSHAEKWATALSIPCYAIDDETAIKVVGETVEVISEGHWKLFEP